MVAPRDLYSLEEVAQLLGLRFPAVLAAYKTLGPATQEEITHGERPSTLVPYALPVVSGEGVEMIRRVLQP